MFAPGCNNYVRVSPTRLLLHPPTTLRAMSDHPLKERIEDLERRRAEAVRPGSARAIERQHAKGKMTARERVEYLLDEGSFQELDLLARHRAFDSDLADDRPYTD